MKPAPVRRDRLEKLQRAISKMEQFERESRIVALYGYLALGVALISAAIALELPVRWLAFFLFAITPATYFAMHHFAHRRGLYPSPDGRSSARAVQSLVVMALVFAAAVFAYGVWGAPAGAVGSIAYYIVTWFAARRLAAHTHVVRERRGLSGSGHELPLPRSPTTEAGSPTWNYGPGLEAELLDAYGVDPDPERTAYYRLLWDVS